MESKTKKPMRRVGGMMKNSAWCMPVAIIFHSIVLGVFIIGASIILDNSNNNIGSPVAPSVVSGDSQDDSGVAPSFATLADQVGVDVDKFTQCFNEGNTVEDVQEQRNSGVAAGVTGTPASFVMARNGDVYFINGLRDYATTAQIIEYALDGTEPTDQNIIVHADTAPAPVTDDDHILGNKNAPVMLIEYSDISCGFCRNFHPVLHQIVEDYDGQVAWVYRHFAVLNDYSSQAAQASECVADIEGNDAFWEYVDALFS